MVSVGLDVGPLHGRRTGIGNAVAWVLDDLDDRPGLDIVPYVVSARAKLAPPQRRLPLPGAVAHRLWAMPSAPPMDRFLGRPDVVHGTNYVVPPTRCPRVVSVYDCWFLEHPELAGPDVRRAGAVLRRAVADGAAVLTSSEATAARVRALLGGDRVHAAHLGPPPIEPWTPGSADAASAGGGLAERLTDRTFVLALGTVERRKDLPTLVAAFEQLAENHPDALLVLAGADGDAATELAGRVDRLDARTAARVIRADTVDRSLKAWLLHHAAALAYPSLDEGFGFPVLEAQQAGVPVVASNAGSIAEIAGDGALFGPPGDADALAANLHAVLDGAAVRDALVDRGTANLGRFSWRATGDAYLALYEELANR